MRTIQTELQQPSDQHDIVPRHEAGHTASKILKLKQQLIEASKTEPNRGTSMPIRQRRCYVIRRCKPPWDAQSAIGDDRKLWRRRITE